MGKLHCISEWKKFKKFLGQKISSGEVIFTSARKNMGIAKFCLTIADVLKDINQPTESIIGAESLEICFNTFLKFHLTWALLEAGVSIMRKSRFNECSKIIESIHVVFYIRNHFIRKSAWISKKIKKKSKKLGRLRYKYP